MKKIFYVANVRLPTEKAHGLAIMKMCEAFANQGLEVELVVPKRANHIDADPFEYYGVEKNFKITKLWCLDLVKWGKVGFWVETITFAERAAWYSLFKKGIYYTREEFLAFYLKLFGKKVFWEAHTIKSSWSTPFLKLLDGVITISNGLKDYYVSLGISSEKILIAHSGVDLKLFDIKKTKEEIRKELSLPLDKKIVAYVGKEQTMGKDKGVVELRAVLEGLKKDNSEIYPLFVTDVSFKKVPLYMKLADVLVMNYPDTEHYAKYMSPLKLFEYMASGVPMVAPSLPSIREVLNDSSALLFKPNDINSLTIAIKHALSDINMVQIKSEEALKNIKIYTWENRSVLIIKFML